MKETLFELMGNRKSKKVAKMLFSLLKEREQNDHTEILDWIGSLLEIDNIYFMEKIYPKFIRKIDKLPYPTQIAIDRYILENYCLSNDEEIIAINYGEVSSKFNSTIGRLYLTNFRLFASGKQIEKGKPNTFMLPGTIHLITSTIYRASKDMKRNKKIKGFEGLVENQKPQSQVFTWGYEFPVKKASDLEIKKNKVILTLTID